MSDNRQSSLAKVLEDSKKKDSALDQPNLRPMSPSHGPLSVPTVANTVEPDLASEANPKPKSGPILSLHAIKTPHEDSNGPFNKHDLLSIRTQILSTESEEYLRSITCAKTVSLAEFEEMIANCPIAQERQRLRELSKVIDPIRIAKAQAKKARTEARKLLKQQQKQEQQEGEEFGIQEIGSDQQQQKKKGSGLVLQDVDTEGNNITSEYLSPLQSPLNDTEFQSGINEQLPQPKASAAKASAKAQPKKKTKKEKMAEKLAQ